MAEDRKISRREQNPLSRKIVLWPWEYSEDPATVKVVERVVKDAAAACRDVALQAFTESGCDEGAEIAERTALICARAIDGK